MTANDHELTYQDSNGWVITVPPCWHVVPFSEMYDGITTAGAQVSNVPLPPPSFVPGYTLQVNDRVLPAYGIGLIIAANADSYPSAIPVTVLPLTWPRGWLKGSAPPGSCHMAGVSFRVGNAIFTASVKFGPEALGPQAHHADLHAFAAAIHSIRQAQDTN